MTCVHLRRLYQLFQQEGVRLSAPELIHVVCPSCGEKEVCPSQLMDGLESSDVEEDLGKDGKVDQGGGAFSA